MSLSAVRRARDTLDRWVLLRDAEAAAEARPEGRLARSFALHAAADVRRDAALSHSGIAALALAREAVALYVEATVRALADDALEVGAPTATLWERYDALAARNLVDRVPPSLATPRARSASPVSADDEFAEHGEPATDAMLELATFLAGVVDVRTPGRIRRERRLRQLTLAVACLLLVAELIMHRPRGANVALHAAVVASSRRMTSGPPGNLTNGLAEAGASFSTKDEPDPWVTIDLLTAQRIHEVTLVPGAEREDDTVPLRVETSVDGAGWSEAATQSMPAPVGDAAVLGFSRRTARFVRIHGRPGGAIYLSEVEVR